MTYKVLHGVELTSELLNKWIAKGWVLVDFESRQGLYDIVFSDGSGGGGGGSSIKDAETIDSTLHIEDKTLGVNVNNANSNVDLIKTPTGLTAQTFWKEYKAE